MVLDLDVRVAPVVLIHHSWQLKNGFSPSAASIPMRELQSRAKNARDGRRGGSGMRGGEGALRNRRGKARRGDAGNGGESSADVGTRGPRDAAARAGPRVAR